MYIRIAAYRTLMLACAILIALWAGGCGGGVTTTPAAAGAPAPAPQAVITLNTLGTLTAGTGIGGLGITIDLPNTVTVKTTAGGNVDNGVVVTSGVAAGQASVLVLYSDATVTVPAKLYILLASSTVGMPVGEFATVTCEIRPGGNPVASDFGLNDFSAVDTSGASIPSLTASLHAAVK